MANLPRVVDDKNMSNDEPQWRQQGNAWTDEGRGGGFNQQYPTNPQYPGMNGGPTPQGQWLPYPGQGSMSRDDDRTFAMISHIAGPIGMLFSIGWLGFIGPLVVWLIYKDRSPYVRIAAARSFNFSVAMTVASIAAWLMVFTVILIPVAILVWIVVFVMEIYYPIKAMMVASRYEVATYPWEIKILS